LNKIYFYIYTILKRLQPKKAPSNSPRTWLQTKLYFTSDWHSTIYNFKNRKRRTKSNNRRSRQNHAGVEYETHWNLASL